ncbi:hypothetical protein M9H77_03912 [Catharanthus roseus]|uniref:Uncharacterized protein n=1 Tax=Catharanthus roseus TaxID=4058 RepID=A0ACC0CCL3_CATRO|nr:hypothetical protein M9H77_03912 [Catharanthus roseus]
MGMNPRILVYVWLVHPDEEDGEYKWKRAKAKQKLRRRKMPAPKTITYRTQNPLITVGQGHSRRNWDITLPRTVELDLPRQVPITASLNVRNEELGVKTGLQSLLNSSSVRLLFNCVFGLIDLRKID